MERDRSRFKYRLLIIVSIIVSAFIFVQMLSLQTVGMATAANIESAHDEIVPVVDNCQISVHIMGAGSVIAQMSNDQPKELAAAENNLQVACDGAVYLTAKPDPLWRFDSWQGVPEEMQAKYSITIDGPAEVTAVFTRRDILRFETVEVPFIDRGGQLVTEIPIYESAWRTSDVLEEDADPSPPSIEVWYGDTQSFGHIGVTQEWLNILGNVSDPDGDLQTLAYSLNGSPASSLSFGGDGSGADGRRNYRQGDFNVDINTANVYLNDGPNSVVITATDSLTETTSLVSFNYDSSNVWPQTYGIDWSTTSSLQDVVQIIDGKWDFSSAGVYPVETGYDRLVSIGDISWSDFELTVPVTVHNYSLEGFGPIQNRPAIGLVMRWQGHTTFPDLCDQPLCGYYPIGAAAWYEFPSSSSEDGEFSIWSNTAQKTMDTTGYTLDWDETYLWKVRSQSVAGTTGRYSMKIWLASGDEPDEWLITRDGRYDSHLSGSALLLSHHVNVTFGDVTVVPIDVGDDPPQVSNIRLIPEPYGTTVRWSTNKPARSQLDFGLTSSYGRSVTSAEYVTEHSAYLSELDPQTTYHFKITVTDTNEKSNSTDDDEFTTQELVSLVSDDFNACDLDPSWTFIDPLDDSSYELNGEQALISVPAGTNHDIFPKAGFPTNRAPRLMRPVTDPSDLKVKFDSGLSVETEMQGILVEQDSENFLRINYQYKAGQVELRAMGFRSGANPTTLKKVNLPGIGSDDPLYLWLTRPKGQWQIEYSVDGENWSELGLFTFPLSVTQAGVFAGNYHPTPGDEPAFTTIVDYYFDAKAPIDPEDADPLSLPVNIFGNGSVTSVPSCGNPVTLTADADPGWNFVEWQGSPIDGRIDLQITTPFENGDEVTAVFAEGEPETYSLNWDVDGQGSVLPDPSKAEYIRGETVELTADPADGWEFASWGGDLSGTDPVQTILMDSDKNVTANFTYAEFNLVVTVVGPGQVQISPQGPYDYGDKVKLTAVPNVDSLASFVGWSGDINSTENPLELEMTDDIELTATFITHQQFMPVTMRLFGS